MFVPNPKGSSKPPRKRPSAVEKPVSQVKPPIQEEEKEKASPADDLDFALAFADPDNTVPASQSEKGTISGTVSRSSSLQRVFSVPRNIVRVALHRNLSRLTVYSIGTVAIRATKKYGNKTCRGRIAIKGAKRKNGHARAILETSAGGTFAVFLPCTLRTRSAHNYFELDENSYRGALILIPGNGTSFSVINYCEVEQYLRGVVPLEIGKRSEEDIEAVKAQAVAARTYTYKKIIKRQKAPFDLLATVEDQVYGGVTAEYPLSDRAIRMTKDRVAVYGDSLIYAYYHSTCGGVTANIADVWGKQPFPYLQSIRDVDRNGKAYCAISNYFTWRESWSTTTLSSFIKKYSSRAFPNHPAFSGAITGITVLGNFPCGRVSICRINTRAGEYKYGGDKIRFMLRRNIAGRPILRSARFSIQSVNAKKVFINGRGYGHGVGMCQMGALGRARAGQLFQEILQAYYRGIRIASIKVEAGRKTLVYD